MNAVYAVTNFWEHLGPHGAGDAGGHEFKQAVKIASAAAYTPTIEHNVWSTVPEASAISEGRALVPHMDSKARVDNYIWK